MKMRKMKMEGKFRIIIKDFSNRKSGLLCLEKALFGINWDIKNLIEVILDNFYYFLCLGGKVRWRWESWGLKVEFMGFKEILMNFWDFRELLMSFFMIFKIKILFLRFHRLKMDFKDKLRKWASKFSGKM